MELDFIGKYGLKVQSGPFAGMKYVPHSCGSVFIPKLLGCYEAELHDLIEEEIVPAGYRTIVVVGSGEGYYAVGLAMRLKRAVVHAFDTDPFACLMSRKLARLNQVEDRITVHDGACSPELLNELVSAGPALVVCDIEGGELELLQPERVPALREADLLVELHDFVNRAISGTITARFADTHQLRLEVSSARDSAHYPTLDVYVPEERPYALTEMRPETMVWAFLTKRKPARS